MQDLDTQTLFLKMSGQITIIEFTNKKLFTSAI